jgi:hypothetical protein
MLTVDDVEKDYEAVMSSREHIRNLYGEEYCGTWPEENMTINDNLEDLLRHQTEFVERKSFAYTVMSLDESICLGCVYISPSKNEDFEAEIDLWARASEIENGLEGILYKTVREWINEKWPFKKVLFPCLIEK